MCDFGNLSQQGFTTVSTAEMDMPMNEGVDADVIALIRQEGAY